MGQEVESLSLSRAFMATLKRELKIANRQRSELVSPLFFFIMVVSLFPLGVSPEPALLKSIAPGVIWIAALLATMMAADVLFKHDFEDGTLEQLLLSPQPLFILVIAKVISHWLTTGLLLTLLSPLLAAMLYLGTEQGGVLLLSLLLGTPVLCFINAIGAALTVGLRKGGILITLITLPLHIPILIFGTGCVQASIYSMPYQGQLAILAAMLVLAITLAPFAIGAALRISVSG
ncbi:MAG: heme exporter protein CcmB [Pseudomonadales bacterium]|nr:heme exporter protein CcmB [Pseudomonadales bacterium]MBL4868479.1 heme exporter protein CcmB [Pseudomonadales bacterium]